MSGPTSTSASASAALRILVQLHPPLTHAGTPSTTASSQSLPVLLLLSPDRCATLADLAYRVLTQLALEARAPQGLLLTLDVVAEQAAATGTPQPRTKAATAASDALLTSPPASHCVLLPSEPLHLLRDWSTVHVWRREQEQEQEQEASSKQRRRSANSTQAAIQTREDVAATVPPLPAADGTASKKRRRSVQPAAAPTPAHVPTPAAAAPVPAASLTASSSVAAVPAAPVIAEGVSRKSKKQRREEARAAAMANTDATPSAAAVPTVPAGASVPAASAGVAVPSATAAVAAAPAAVPAVPTAAPVVPATSTHKKTRRGKKRRGTAANGDGTVTTGAAAATSASPSAPVAAKPASRRATVAPMDTSDSSSDSSSSDSDSSDSSEDSAPAAAAMRATPAKLPPAPAAATPVAASTPQPLQRLPKGHFRFTDAEDGEVVAPVGSVTPVTRAQKGASATSTPAAAAKKKAPAAFFVSSTDHAAAGANMPRTKQQRQQKERGGRKQSGVAIASSDAVVPAAGVPGAPATPAAAAVSTVAAPAASQLTAVPFDYAAAAEADQSAAETAAAVAAASAEEARDERAEVSLALETYGAHFIAPRTLKRIADAAGSGGGGGNDWARSLTADRDRLAQPKRSFDECPPVDLLANSPPVQPLQPGDVLAYKSMELSAEWTPVLSEYRTIRVRSHDMAAGTLQGSTAAASPPSERKESDPAPDDDEDVLTLQVRDLSSCRLVEGPSYTRAMAEWRQAQRAAKKQEKWQRKQQQHSPASGQAQTQAHVHSKGTQQRSTPSNVAGAPVGMTRGRIFRSTNFSLMSNCVRALQQRQQQEKLAASPSPPPASASSPTSSLHPSRQHRHPAETHTRINGASGSVTPSSTPSAPLLPTPAPAPAATAATVFVVPPSAYHLPTRHMDTRTSTPVHSTAVAPPTAAPSVPAAAAAAAAAAPSPSPPAPTASPSLSELEQLLQQKRRELEARAAASS